MSQKTWKDHLLMTGLPLEMSVKAILGEFGMGHARELSFERENEQGETVVASADLLGEAEAGAVQARFLLECKYRRDGVQWLFTPADAAMRKIATLDRVHSIVPKFHYNLSFKRRDLTASVAIPVVSKGVEIKDDSAFDAELRKAIFQLRYGLHYLFRHYLLDMADGEDRGDVLVPAFVPIVVTTAPLWSLREGVGVEEVRAAKEFTDVAERRDALLVYDSPDLASMREFLARTSGFDEQTKDELRTLATFCGEKIERVFHNFARRPLFYYVVELPHLADLLSNILGSLAGLPFERLDKEPDPTNER